MTELEPAPSEAAWVGRLCGVALHIREGPQSIAGLFAEANPQTDDRVLFLSAVTSYLRQHRDVIRSWSTYSGDKRTDSGAYFDLGAPSEVGLYSRGYEDVRRYEDPADACADFLWREVSSMLGSPKSPGG